MKQGAAHICFMGTKNKLFLDCICPVTSTQSPQNSGGSACCGGANKDSNPLHHRKDRKHSFDHVKFELRFFISFPRVTNVQENCHLSLIRPLCQMSAFERFWQQPPFCFITLRFPWCYFDTQSSLLFNVSSVGPIMHGPSPQCNNHLFSQSSLTWPYKQLPPPKKSPQVCRHWTTVIDDKH